MSITLTFRFKVAGVLTDLTSATLSDPTGAYGIKRNDTDAVVVADGAAMTHSATGIYTYSFDEPAADLTYGYYVEWVYAGETTHTPFTYEATSRIVTVEEIKRDLRYTEDDQDTYLEHLIDLATALAEEHQGRKFLTTSVTDYLDAWPALGVIFVAYSPLIAVDSITYVDTNGDSQTWDSAEYDVDTHGFVGRIRPGYDYDFPDARAQMNAIAVTYTAGYGAGADDVPENVKGAVRMTVYRWFETLVDLSGSQPAMPKEARDLLGYNRIITV